MESLVNHFIYTTPLAEKSEYRSGIKNFSETFFGPPPNKDGSNEINIIILDIRDNFSDDSNNYIADILIEMIKQTMQQVIKDIVYIDCYPTNMVADYPEEACLI